MNSVFEVFAGMSALTFAGILSGVLSTLAFLPYIIDTIARRTHPQRASWLIRSVLGAIAFSSQVFEGATESLWFAGAQVTGTIIVFLLSILVGVGVFLSRADVFVLLLAGVGLVLWYQTDTAIYALAITIAISVLGGVVTVAKAFHNPDSETMTTWAISCAASVFAIISVGKADLILLAYPLYLFTLTGAIVLAMTLGRVVRQRSAAMPVTA